MKILGHNFLRSNFKPGDPTRLTAKAQQVNTVANILKDIQGVNCRIVKDTTAEGRGWMIVVGAGSDIQPPDSIPATTTDKASTCLCDSYTSSGIILPFETLDHETNSAIIEAQDADTDGKYDQIQVYEPGIYTVQFTCQIATTFTASGEVAAGTASLKVDGETSMFDLAAGMLLDNIRAIDASTAQLGVYSSFCANLKLSASVLQIEVNTMGTGSVTNGRFSVSLYEKTTEE